VTDKILLILSTLVTDDDRIAIKKSSRGRDVEVERNGKQGDGRAIEEAFRYAESTSKKVVALQILTSHLYHWGRNDSILSGPGKARFLIYVRDEVLRRGKDRAKELQERAQNRGISLKIRSVESEHPVSTVIQEAEKGYDSIFLPKKRKGLFPIFEKTLAQHLHKKVSSHIIEC
jgi:hypothetical protein